MRQKEMSLFPSLPHNTPPATCGFTLNPFTVRQITVIVGRTAAITHTYLFYTHTVVGHQIICMHDFHNRIRQYGLPTTAGVDTIGRIFRPFVVLSPN